MYTSLSCVLTTESVLREVLTEKNGEKNVNIQPKQNKLMSLMYLVLA